MTGMSTGTDLLARVRDAAASRTPAGERGLWVSFLSPYGLEAALGSGSALPGWLGVDLQHGDLGASDVAGLLRVAEHAGLPLLTRMPSHDGGLIGKVLDAGVYGVIVPTVDSADQARALAAAARTPPDGHRSTGLARTALGVTDPAVRPLLLPMVETADGLANAQEILAVDGVDGVFVGPYDLSASCGFPDPASPQTIAALRSVIGLARVAGKVVGCYAGNPTLAALADEVDLVALDSDVAALRLGLGQLFG